jgi:hypothetical protein
MQARLIYSGILALNKAMITREQIVSAMAGLGWTYQDLSARMKERNEKDDASPETSVTSISSFLRKGRGHSRMSYDRVYAICAVLTEAGVDFGEGNWVSVPREALINYKSAGK